MWGSLGSRTPSPKPAWSGALGAYTTHSLVHLMAESKVSVADREPKIRRLKVRARLFAGKQVLSLWRPNPCLNKAH